MFRPAATDRYWPRSTFTLLGTSKKRRSRSIGARWLGGLDGIAVTIELQVAVAQLGQQRESNMRWLPRRRPLWKGGNQCISASVDAQCGQVGRRASVSPTCANRRALPNPGVGTQLTDCGPSGRFGAGDMAGARRQLRQTRPRRQSMARVLSSSTRSSDRAGPGSRWTRSATSCKWRACASCQPVEHDRDFRARRKWR